MSTEQKQSKPLPIQVRLFLAGSLFIISGLTGMRAGRQVYNMTGATSLTPGVAAPTEIVEQNWMYPVGCLSLAAGVITSIAAGVVAIRQRSS